MPLEIIIVTYLAVITMMLIITIGDYNEIEVMPLEIFDNSSYNIFACVILWLIAFLFNPLFYILHFIDWLAHVGRKD